MPQEATVPALDSIHAIFLHFAIVQQRRSSDVARHVYSVLRRSERDAAHAPGVVREINRRLYTPIDYHARGLSVKPAPSMRCRRRHLGFVDRQVSYEGRLIFGRDVSLRSYFSIAPSRVAGLDQGPVMLILFWQGMNVTGVEREHVDVDVLRFWKCYWAYLDRRDCSGVQDGRGRLEEVGVNVPQEGRLVAGEGEEGRVLAVDN
mmetsp:Transcript_14965/g.27816  ORF Transcript_14965/g.27816 Transcript_14965/m.27816 type:complete len:204 (+) Transcript_14965:265-876(+)